MPISPKFLQSQM